MKKRKIKFKHFRRLLEFFIVGIVFGIAEDVLAVLIATKSEFSWKILGIVTIVAIPFAVISELIVDKAEFKFLKKWWNKKN